MFRKLILSLAFFLCAATLRAQTPRAPDCVLQFSFTAASPSVSSGNRAFQFDNRGSACTTWHLTYWNNGFSALSIQMDEAPDSTAGGTPGTWVTWPNVASGALPLTATTQGQITGYKYFPWVSVNLNSITGSGTVSGTAFGWRPVSTQDSSAIPNADLTTSATSLSAAINNGSDLFEKGPRWSVFSNPAAGSQGTASKAAGGAGVRHVVDCVSFSAASVVAPALTALTVNLRDGATGAGTVLWTQQLAISATTGQNVTPFSVCGLALLGTANTAMTLEFSASLASLSEAVSISGFDVN